MSPVNISGSIRKNISILAATVGVLVGAATASHAQLTTTTYFGVNATEWKTVNGSMKLDFDWVRNRFVVQHEYGVAPPKYATIDLATKNLLQFAQTPSGTFHETLLTVMPQQWNNFGQGTTFVSSGGSGNIYAIDPSGSVSTFATGLPNGTGAPTGTRYTTVRWDEYGVANSDLFYANESSGQVSRVDSSGNIVWTTTLFHNSQELALPEAMIVLGVNSRWGPYQRKVIVGQNSFSTNIFSIDPASGSYSVLTSPIPGAPETFRVYHSRTGAPLALYASVYNGMNSKIVQLTNFGGVPNLQTDDLFIARELSTGGEIYHVYWDSGSNSFQGNLIASFNGSGYFLEDMVFAPVPEPGSLLALSAGLASLFALRRRKA